MKMISNQIDVQPLGISRLYSIIIIAGAQDPAFTNNYNKDWSSSLSSPFQPL
jgi:hypothetical protein